MNTRISFLLALAVWVSAEAARSQDIPPPLPAPAVVPMPPPSPLDPSPGAAVMAVPPQNSQLPAYPSPGSYSPPPGSYSPPPGAVMMAPGQVYPYGYPPPNPYAGPVVVAPPVTVLVPAPPLPSYQWSATVDALFLERSSGGSIPLGFTYVNSYPPALPTDKLYSDDSYFPLETGLRLEISRKFDNNIALAATYWGLQKWSVGNTIYGDNSYESVLAYSPLLQWPIFDNSLGYSYGSQIQNVEINALYRLNPSNPYWEVNWLWGARYVYYTENFTLTGVDDMSGITEQLNYHTSNNLVGVQTGLQFVHGWARFQWEAGLKCGLMANIYHQHGTDTASDPTAIVPYDISNNGTGLSALIEVSVGLRYRLTENLGLRLGYQFYDFTGLALAPRQLSSFGHGGYVAFDGLSIGLQGTW